MNKVMPRTIRETIHTLLQYGFQECTDAASRQNDTPYLYAFKRPGDEKGVCYCCETEDDLFALVSLVKASVSQ